MQRNKNIYLNCVGVNVGGSQSQSPTTKDGSKPPRAPLPKDAMGRFMKADMRYFHSGKRQAPSLTKKNTKKGLNGTSSLHHDSVYITTLNSSYL